jgi:MYXO-CTERM domain-containing protein
VSVFVRSGTTWTQQAMLPAMGGDVRHVSLSGDTALVGGSVFVRSGTSWTQQATLVPKDDATGCTPDGSSCTTSNLCCSGLCQSNGTCANTGIGSAALSGDTVILGAPNETIGSNATQGAVYVFTRSGATWTQTAKLVASDGAMYGQLGFTLALSGDVAVVQGFQGGIAAPTLAAYVFGRTGTTWTQQAELTRPNDGCGRNTGLPVAVSGGTVVFSLGDYDPYMMGAYTSVDVYQQNGTTWTQQMKLTEPAAPAGTGFGESIAVSGGTILVGAAQGCPASTPGSAFVYVLSGAAGSQCSQDSDCQSGTCMNGTCAGGPSSGTTTSGGSSSGGPGGSSGSSGPGHSSGCSTAGGASEGAAWLGALGAALAAARRRRRARARLID